MICDLSVCATVSIIRGGEHSVIVEPALGSVPPLSAAVWSLLLPSKMTAVLLYLVRKREVALIGLRVRAATSCDNNDDSCNGNGTTNASTWQRLKAGIVLICCLSPAAAAAAREDTLLVSRIVPPSFWMVVVTNTEMK